jgi:hypothetical protein
MLIDSGLHQIIAVITGLTDLFPASTVVSSLCVLHAAVTLATLYLVPAGTLASELITLQICGPSWVTLTRCAALKREPIVVRLTHVTPRPGDSRPTEALARVHVAGGIDRSHWVTVARVTAHIGIDAEVTVLATVTVMTNHIGFARALASVAVADRQCLILVQVGAWRVALAGLAILGLPGFSNGSGIAKETRLAAFTPESSSVIDTAQTLPRNTITVSDCIGIDIAIAIALAACPRRPLEAVRVTKVTVGTLLTTGAIPALWTLCTNRAGWIARYFKTGPHTQLAPRSLLYQRTWALLAVIGCAYNGIPIVASSTVLTVVPISVVVALAAP